MWEEKRYPANWLEMARECKERAEWRCQHCTVEHGTERLSKRTGQPYQVRLAAAHLDHDPENCDPRLAALCPSCHGRYDWTWREREADIKLERMKHHLRLKRKQR